MFERRLYYHIDWALVVAMFALCGIGVVMIYSTTSDPTRASSHLWTTQLYAIFLGVIAMLVTLSIDYRTFTDKSHWIYIALIAVLVYVMFFGTVQMGARRWIPLKFFNLQPSEFAKIGVALVLASFSFQVIYNITMSAGLAPVKGLTLPLMSYGGSSMIATLAGFGLVLNVRMRRFTN